MDPVFKRAVDLIDAGDESGLRAHLKQHPGLARKRVVFEGMNYFENPSLLQFIAENPTRRGSLPANIAEVARVILEAGATQEVLNRTLELVASSAVAQHYKVQAPLIELLCGYGADPNHANRVAAIYAQLDAIHALLRAGARFTLPLATIMGRVEDARRLIAEADDDDRQWAMAIAAQYGDVEIMRLLLDAGVDPNRYNPLGGHSHSTPLHQAAGSGHLASVRLLVERGANLDWKDTMWDATPAGWAQHEGKPKLKRTCASKRREFDEANGRHQARGCHDRSAAEWRDLLCACPILLARFEIVIPSVAKRSRGICGLSAEEGSALAKTRALPLRLKPSLGMSNP